MSWITLQIISTLLASVNSIADKHLVRDHEPSPMIYLASFAVVGLPVTAVGVWLVPWPGLQAVLTGTLSGILFAIAVLSYYRAMNLGEVSRLVPLLRLSSIFKLILLAVFLNDRLTLTQYVAFSFMLFGALALAQKSGQFRKKLRWHQGNGVSLMVIAAFLLAVGSVLDSQLILSHSPWTLAVWSNTGRVLVFSLLLVTPKYRIEFLSRVKTTSTRFRTAVIGEQTGRLVTGLLSDFAVMAAGSAAITSVLAGIRPFIVMVMAMIFLNEKLQRNEIAPRICGLGFICIGTLLLFLSS